jgi:nucleoside-diphosphate-sugar epimerase
MMPLPQQSCKRQQNRLKSVPLITWQQSFTPTEIAAEIKTHIQFTISYKPDFRQIADSWPASIDDNQARADWNWKHKFDLKTMTIDMLEHLK